MNSIASFLIEVALTVIIFSFTIAYLRPFLRRILVDICGTEERAQFWTAFANILLIGFPLIFALEYHPKATSVENLFFEIVSRVSGSLAGFLVAMLGIGLFVSFFAFFTPKSRAETK
jgi:hypothetical protein